MSKVFTSDRERTFPALSRLRLILDGEIKFEFCRKFVFGVKTIGEVDATNPTIGVDLWKSEGEGEEEERSFSCLLCKI